MNFISSSSSHALFVCSSCGLQFDAIFIRSHVRLFLFLQFLKQFSVVLVKKFSSCLLYCSSNTFSVCWICSYFSHNPGRLSKLIELLEVISMNRDHDDWILLHYLFPWWRHQQTSAVVHNCSGGSKPFSNPPHLTFLLL